MAPRDSTSLRLAPQEKALISKAAAALGDELGAFIRIAARERAEQVLADASYRHFLEEKAAQAARRSTAEPSLSAAQLRSRLARRRRAK